MWSMWAWLTTMASRRRGSKGRLALSAAASARRPWNNPASSRIRAPAASSRCMEPVTWPAAPQKVILAPLIRSPGPKNTVAGGAQARQDVPDVVELPVERRGKYRHGRVRVEHGLHAFRRGYQAKEADPGGPGSAQFGDHSNRRGSRGQRRGGDGR